MSHNIPPPGYGGAPQPHYGGGPGGQKPHNNLVWGIVTTILCCLPLGVVSIVKATKVDTLWLQGDFAGAQKAADEAKQWAMYALFGGIAYVIVIVVMLAAGVTMSA